MDEKNAYLDGGRVGQNCTPLLDKALGSFCTDLRRQEPGEVMLVVIPLTSRAGATHLRDLMLSIVTLPRQRTMKIGNSEAQINQGLFWRDLVGAKKVNCFQCQVMRLAHKELRSERREKPN